MINKSVSFKNYKWLERAGFTLVELLVVIALIGILVTIVIVAINPVERLKNARDTDRKSAIAQIALGLNVYLVLKGYYPEDIEDIGTWSTEGCDSSKGSSATADCADFCPPGCPSPANWDTTRGIYFALVSDTKIMLNLPKDPQNFSMGGWWYKYEPASPGEPGTGCPASAPGPCYYYLAARLESGPRANLYSLGYPECSGPPCTYVFVCHDYPDDKYFKQFYTMDMLSTIDGLSIKGGCGVRVSKNST